MEEIEMICKICQSEVFDKTIYCPYCGYQMQPEDHIFVDASEKRLIQKEKTAKRYGVMLFVVFIFYIYSAFIFLTGHIFNINTNQMNNVYRIYTFLRQIHITVGWYFMILGIFIMILQIRLLTRKKNRHSIYRMVLLLNIGLFVLYIIGSYVIIKSMIYSVNVFIHTIFFILMVGMLVYITLKCDAA